MSTTVEEMRSSAELRLRELQTYIDEAAQLRQIIAFLDEQQGDSAAGSTVDAQLDRPVGERAPQGSNKRRILDVVLKNPGITAAEIARRTGLKRTVVASTVSRLKRTGELEPAGRGARVPVSRTAEVLALLAEDPRA
jgi:predicted transcriptional regulator